MDDTSIKVEHSPGKVVVYGCYQGLSILCEFLEYSESTKIKYIETWTVDAIEKVKKQLTLKVEKFQELVPKIDLIRKASEVE